MTETYNEAVRPTLADKTPAEKRDTIVVLIMSILAMAAAVWYFAKLAFGDAAGAERLIPLVTILFFSSVGFDAKKETTSPAVHVLTKANWAVMAVFALTIVIPILLK